MQFSLKTIWHGREGVILPTAQPPTGILTNLSALEVPSSPLDLHSVVDRSPWCFPTASSLSGSQLLSPGLSHLHSDYPPFSLQSIFNSSSPCSALIFAYPAHLWNQLKICPLIGAQPPRKWMRKRNK